MLSTAQYAVKLSIFFFRASVLTCFLHIVCSLKSGVCREGFWQSTAPARLPVIGLIDIVTLGKVTLSDCVLLESCLFALASYSRLILVINTTPFL